ncbi:MAG: response regulator [Fusobacterium sp.]|nr:response regulator [Fusobacterium sp.]MDO5788045.1 response regulator [Fusobacterium sp.]
MEKKKILIIDDERNIRMTLTYCLEAEGYETDIAINGEEGLDILLNQKKKYDLILLDIKMPGKTGMEVLKELRENDNNSNVIMMTAYGTIKEAVTAIKLNAIDFISKPFTPDQIKTLVAKVFSRENLQEDKLNTFEEYIEFAKLSIIGKKFDKAIEALRIAISKEPGRPDTHNLLGVIEEYKGNIDEAQKYYRAALALDPSYEPANSNLDRITELESIINDIKLG